MPTLSLDAQELLEQLLAKAPSREEKEKLRMAADALRFIASTGQSHFQTREAAEGWLALQPEPPRQVFITIAGEYHLAVCHHRIHLRALYPVSLAAKPQQEPQ